jgi:uncharacterized membrane protein YfcA
MWAEIFASLSVTTLAFLWTGAFLGGIASGAAGFAYGVVASAIWLHAIAPVHAVFLVVSGGLITQTTTIWSFRRSLSWWRLWPFLLAGVLGVPIGIWLLVRTDIEMLKVGLGCFLAVYGLYALLAPRLPHVQAGRGADAVIGFIGGILGGLGGFSGVLPAIWTQIRGWPKDEARAFFQPFIVVIHIATLVAIGTVALDRRALVLLALMLPALVAGIWVGWYLYGRLDERRFRQALALMLLLSGVILIL